MVVSEFITILGRKRKVIIKQGKKYINYQKKLVSLKDAKALQKLKKGGTTVQMGQYKVIELSDEANSKLLKKFQSLIPNSCMNITKCSHTSYLDVLKAISNDFEEDIFVVGGAVRDFIQTENPDDINDIDINYSTNVSTLTERLNSLNLNFKVDERNYIVVGDKTRGDYLEGFYITPTMYKPENLECPANSLMLKIEKTNNTVIKFKIIDVFNGIGIEDAKTKQWRAPSDSDDWFKNQTKLLWRMLKFKLRDYTVPDATAVRVYSYWYNNESRISDYTWQNMWWTIKPEDVEKVLDIITNDVDKLSKFLSFSSGKFLYLLVKKKLLMANKV